MSTVDITNTVGKYKTRFFNLYPNYLNMRISVEEKTIKIRTVSLFVVLKRKRSYKYHISIVILAFIFQISERYLFLYGKNTIDSILESIFVELEYIHNRISAKFN